MGPADHPSWRHAEERAFYGTPEGRAALGAAVQDALDAWRAQDVAADAKLRAALNELVPEAWVTDEAILETTSSQIYDAVVYRRRRQKTRNANRSAARQVG